MFDIITFGSASKDITLKPKNLTVLKYKKEFTLGKGLCLPIGSKIDVEEITFNSGGGGTNTAATFVLQGFKTAFYGMVGKDQSGQEVINELKKLKVDTKFILKTSKKPTNYSIIISQDFQDRTILAYRGASDLLSKKDILWQKIKTKWFYSAPLTGLLCLPHSESADSTAGATLFEDIVNFAHKNKIKIALNPSMQQLCLPKEKLVEVFKKIDVLFLNQEEASFLTKIPFEKEKEIFKKIDEICPGVAVMTKGSEGVVVSDGKYLYSAKPMPDRKIIDTTGAGDSFASGFLADYIRYSGDIEKAIQLGMANSQGCLSQIGAKNGLLKKGQKFERVEVLKNKL